MSREGPPPYSVPIVSEFEGRHTNLFAYPERGPWGNPRYPGNFSGKFVLDLVDLYKSRSVADPFRGGGTTEGVCKEFGIPYWSGDLRDGFNILEDALPPCSDGSSPDLVMFHLPYFDMIQYSGRVWGEKPHPADLSAAASLDEFVRMANEAQYNAYSHVKQGGHVAILIGSIRRQGVLYPLHRMINLYGELQLDGVKVQFNTTGARTPHPARNIALLVTEWVMVMEKPKSWIVPVRVAQPVREFDQRQSARQTWRSIVLSALEACGGSASLSRLYEIISSHRRAQQAAADNVDWQAIVRRELQEGGFQSIDRGVWRVT
ncbi:MAG: hypothetical protein L6Q98_24190 [Anaerolineae bacterium]|nr:hypothetical protein [Anaerolineae bacterium]NUQ06688.1 hypothetical protein [Anaerolineae bacterium]